MLRYPPAPFERSDRDNFPAWETVFAKARSAPGPPQQTPPPTADDIKITGAVPSASPTDEAEASRTGNVAKEEVDQKAQAICDDFFDSGAAEAVLRTPPRPAAPYSGMARKVRELLLASLIDASLSALEPDASGPDLEAELSAPSLAEEGQHADRGRPQRRGSGGPGSMFLADWVSVAHSALSPHRSAADLPGMADASPLSPASVRSGTAPGVAVRAVDEDTDHESEGSLRGDPSGVEADADMDGAGPAMWDVYRYFHLGQALDMMPEVARPASRGSLGRGPESPGGPSSPPRPSRFRPPPRRQGRASPRELSPEGRGRAGTPDISGLLEGVDLDRPSENDVSGVRTGSGGKTSGAAGREDNGAGRAGPSRSGSPLRADAGGVDSRPTPYLAPAPTLSGWGGHVAAVSPDRHPPLPANVAGSRVGSPPGPNNLEGPLNAQSVLQPLSRVEAPPLLADPVVGPSAAPPSTTRRPRSPGSPTWSTESEDDMPREILDGDLAWTGHGAGGTLGRDRPASAAGGWGARQDWSRGPGGGGGAGEGHAHGSAQKRHWRDGNVDGAPAQGEAFHGTPAKRFRGGADSASRTPPTSPQRAPLGPACTTPCTPPGTSPWGSVGAPLSPDRGPGGRAAADLDLSPGLSPIVWAIDERIHSAASARVSSTRPLARTHRGSPAAPRAASVAGAAGVAANAQPSASLATSGDPSGAGVGSRASRRSDWSPHGAGRKERGGSGSEWSGLHGDGSDVSARTPRIGVPRTLFMSAERPLGSHPGLAEAEAAGADREEEDGPGVPNSERGWSHGDGRAAGGVDREVPCSPLTTHEGQAQPSAGAEGPERRPPAGPKRPSVPEAGVMGAGRGGLGDLQEATRRLMEEVRQWGLGGANETAGGRLVGERRWEASGPAFAPVGQTGHAAQDAWQARGPSGFGAGGAREGGRDASGASLRAHGVPKGTPVTPPVWGGVGARRGTPQTEAGVKASLPVVTPPTAGYRAAWETPVGKTGEEGIAGSGEAGRNAHGVGERGVGSGAEPPRQAGPGAAKPPPSARGAVPGGESGAAHASASSAAAADRAGPTSAGPSSQGPSPGVGQSMEPTRQHLLGFCSCHRCLSCGGAFVPHVFVGSLGPTPPPAPPTLHAGYAHPHVQEGARQMPASPPTAASATEPAGARAPPTGAPQGRREGAGSHGLAGSPAAAPGPSEGRSVPGGMPGAGAVPERQGGDVSRGAGTAEAGGPTVSGAAAASDPAFATGGGKFPWGVPTPLELEVLLMSTLQSGPWRHDPLQPSTTSPSGAAAVPLGPPPLAKFSSWREKYRAYLSQA